MKDLAPSIFRQRVIIEGTCDKAITDGEIKDYLSQLSTVLEMRTLIDPVTDYSRFGWAGWIHWETSGAHFYAWDEPFIFFSVDIYTCKEFDVNHAADFTKKYFSASTIAYKSI